MQKPDLIEFAAGTKAKSQEVNQNFEELLDYTFGSIQELKSYIETQIANINLTISNNIYTGKIEIFSGSADAIPTGFLLCNGQEVSRETYSNLFDAIGTVYGEGNGVNTFNVPNLIDKFVEGGNSAGEEKEAGLPNITGSIRAYNDYQGVASGVFYAKALGTVSKGGTTYTGGDFLFDASRCSSVYKDGTKTVQPASLTMLYVIKT